MSASACVAFLGLRYELIGDEIENLEERTDPRQVAAKRAGLTTYWGNFGGDRARYVLLIGTKIAILGPESHLSSATTFDQMSQVMLETKTRVGDAGLLGEVGLHLEWLADA